MGCNTISGCLSSEYIFLLSVDFYLILRHCSSGILWHELKKGQPCCFRLMRLYLRMARSVKRGGTSCLIGDVIYDNHATN